jgi:hypothetical protein
LNSFVYSKESLSRLTMPQITLVDSEFCTHNDDMIRHMVKDDDRASGHLYRDRIERKDMSHCYC